jgi:hypothetical protein
MVGDMLIKYVRHGLETVMISSISSSVVHMLARIFVSQHARSREQLASPAQSSLLALHDCIISQGDG